MAKEIVKADIEKINCLIENVVGFSGNIQIKRMGGLTNHSYRVDLPEARTYAVRIAGDGTEGMINRSHEKISTHLACELGIDADLLYFGQDGAKVTVYIPEAVTMKPETMRCEDYMVQAANIFRKLHNCGENTGVPFEVFDMAQEYENIITNNKVQQYVDYEQIRKSVMEIKQEVDFLCHPVKVPCHNDPLCENWVLGTDRMYLIDWEYAGMNDGLWDLADLSIEAEYDHKQDEKFLQAYFQKMDLTAAIWKDFMANKIYVDFLWTLWALTRVPYDGKKMQDWADERYARLKKNIENYRKV